ncbi:MAG: DNA polymerase/3'-5' exonuclease PolX [Burkholderiales bacterium]|nr:DNA polymerase/3'-5' exonuclease PolX [Burkholderiales bacterium]
MAAVNTTIAAIFDEIADLLEIQGANPFRVRAYRNAASTIGDLGSDVRTFIQRGMPLTDIPGIGEDLAHKIREIIDTGGCEFLRRLEQEVPPGVARLLKVPGLGPKRVKTLWHELDISSVELLLRAAQAQRIRNLPGFGEKTEHKILEALQRISGEERRLELALATQYAEPLAAYLRALPAVQSVEIAGSYRRMRETVGDIDMVVIADDHAQVMDGLARYPGVREVAASGTTRATMLLDSGLQVDVRVVPHASSGAALVYFTGSKAHNIAIRRLGLERGLKINEYGVFRDEVQIAGETEESVYAALDLPWIPPELREDRGEIEAARAGRLPELITLADLRGDLHVRTTASDGQHGAEEMAHAARARGLEYLAITDRSQRLGGANGVDAARLARQSDEIDRLNARLSGFTLLKGIEVDILDDGSLDLPDAVLSRLDIVIAAVHSRFDLPRARQTRRILHALDNPHVHVLAHPLGQLIGERETYDVDMQKIMRKARQRGVALELSAHPGRLDLSDAHCRMAKDEGVLVAIDSDAHATFEFDMLRLGIGQARRGWLERDDVLNTRPLTQSRALLRRAPRRDKR